jgi:hypothetical protein
MKTFKLDCECELFVDEGALKGTDLGPRTGVAMRFGCVLDVYKDSPFSTHEGLWTTPPPFFSIDCTRWLSPLMFSHVLSSEWPSRPVPSPLPHAVPISISVLSFGSSICLPSLPSSALFSSVLFYFTLFYSLFLLSLPLPVRTCDTFEMQLRWVICSIHFRFLVFVLKASLESFSGRIFLRNLGQNSCRGNKYTRGTRVNGALFILCDAAGSGWCHKLGIIVLFAISRRGVVIGSKYFVSFICFQYKKSGSEFSINCLSEESIA